MRAYAEGLRHFSETLRPVEAHRLAAQVVEESRRQALDAWLIVAVMQVEGLLQRVRFTRRGMRIGNRPARRVVVSLAADLKGRLQRLTRKGVAAGPAIQAALTERAQAFYPRDTEDRMRDSVCAAGLPPLSRAARCGREDGPVGARQTKRHGVVRRD